MNENSLAIAIDFLFGSFALISAILTGLTNPSQGSSLLIVLLCTIGGIQFGWGSVRIRNGFLFTSSDTTGKEKEE